MMNDSVPACNACYKKINKYSCAYLSYLGQVLDDIRILGGVVFEVAAVNLGSNFGSIMDLLKYEILILCYQTFVE